MSVPATDELSIEQFAERYANARRELSGVNDVPAIKVRRHLSALLEAEATAEGLKG